MKIEFIFQLLGGNSGPQINATNIAHSCLRGYSIVKKPSRDCVRYEGFYFWRITDYGIYTQAFGAEIHVKNNIFVDSVVGVLNIIVGNGGPVKHEHGDMTISIDNNKFIARSEHHRFSIKSKKNRVHLGLGFRKYLEFFSYFLIEKYTESNSSCSDYANRDLSLIVTSEMTVMNRAPWSSALLSGGHTGVFLPFFAEKGTKFPKKPMHNPREATYNSPNGRSCMKNNIFENFNNHCDNR